MEQLLREGLASLGLPDDGIPSLLRFSELLVEKNKVMNLTAITEPEDIATLHFLDCASLLPLAEWKGKTAYFAGIDKARFKQKVVPGDVLTLETEIIKIKGPIGIGKAVARVNGKLACSAELTFAIS